MCIEKGENKIDKLILAFENVLSDFTTSTCIYVSYLLYFFKDNREDKQVKCNVLKFFKSREN